MRPAEAASRVTARCDGKPERVIVANNTRRIEVRTVGSIYRPRPDEPKDTTRG